MPEVGGGPGSLAGAGEGSAKAMARAAAKAGRAMRWWGAERSGVIVRLQ